MAKEAYYFSHDANSRNDPKILSMMLDYGVEGYGMFWIVVENLREQSEYKLKHNKSTYRALAMQMHKTVEEIKNYINDCINEYELFETDDENFYSVSLLRRMGKKDAIIEARRNAANARWNKDSNSKAMQMHNKSNADELQTDAKEMKLNKGNEIKKDNKEYNVFFEECWELYPSKKGKGKISETKKKEVFKLGEEFKRCIARYIKYVKDNNWLKYQNGSTFFNSGYVDYLDNNVTEETKQVNNNGPKNDESNLPQWVLDKMEGEQ